jgi:hypothetical protein
MRRYGLYDTTRGLTLALAAGVAGLLLWVAAQVGTQTVGRFWAAMGIVAGAGFVLALAHVVGSWTSGLRLRLSPATFTFAFLPVLVCVGWIMFASQPGNGLWEGRLHSWSGSLGLLGLVHALALWHGALALGFGLVLGSSLDAVPVNVLEPVAAPAYGTAPRVADEPVTAERREVVRDEIETPIR